MPKHIAAFYDPDTGLQHCLVVTTDGEKALDAHAPKGLLRVDIPEALYDSKDAPALALIAPPDVVKHVVGLKAALDAGVIVLPAGTDLGAATLVPSDKSRFDE